jgi:hypothetical protein
MALLVVLPSLTCDWSRILNLIFSIEIKGRYNATAQQVGTF